MVKFSVTFVPTHNVYVTVTNSSPFGFSRGVVPSTVKFKSALATAVGDSIVAVGGRSLGTEMRKGTDKYLKQTGQNKSNSEMWVSHGGVKMVTEG